MKFYRKSAIINADCYVNLGTVIPGIRTDEYGHVYVLTFHQERIYLDPGDWVIQEPDNIHYHALKPDVFKDRYERVMHES